MTTSGTYSFNPTIQEIIDESYERIGIDPATLTGRHLKSARFSMNVMFSEWGAKEIHQWTLEQKTQTLTISDPTYDLDTRTYDVFDMVLRRSGVDTPMVPMSRDDYLMIPNKTTTGRPDRYFVDRSLTTPTLTLYLVPENSTDQIIYYQLRRLQDVTAGSETPDVRIEWIEATISGLSAKLAEKFAKDMEAAMLQKAGMALNVAMIAGRDRSPTVIRPRSFVRRR